MEVIYRSPDGAEFKTESECAAHESSIENVFNNLKYYSILFSPNIDTRMFEHQVFIAVNTDQENIITVTLIRQYAARMWGFPLAKIPNYENGEDFIYMKYKISSISMRDFVRAGQCSKTDVPGDRLIFSKRNIAVPNTEKIETKKAFENATTINYTQFIEAY